MSKQMTIVDLVFHLQDNDWDKPDIEAFIAEFGDMTRSEEEWEHNIRLYNSKNMITLREAVMITIVDRRSIDATNIVALTRAANERVQKWLTMTGSDDQLDTMMSLEDTDQILDQVERMIGDLI